ncbi:MAG: AI-2E family transporter [Defluviitaleaceae bacterium]|nr:AI-2E family transporter [Defluviitaleaceae bacterium]
MNKFFKSPLMRSIVPHFILGVLLIAAFRIIMGIEYFTGHIWQFWGVVTPFFFGGIIAYVLNLPCSAIQRLYTRSNNRVIKKRSRALSVLTLFVLIIVLITIALNFIVPAVSKSVTTFISEVENYERTLREWLDTVQTWELPSFLPDINEAAIFDFIQEFIYNLEVGGFANSLWQGIGSTARALFTTILIIISSIYFLIEKDRLKDYVKRMIGAITSAKASETILKYSQKLNHNLHMYIYAQTIDGVILGSLMTGLLLIFRSPHALLLGLILGFVNYIPYFGSIFGTAFAVIVVAFTQGLTTAGVAAIFMFIIQQIDGNFIQPRLLGGSFSLSPLLVIISVTIGMNYAGILGMLVVVPIVAILKDILDEYIEAREYKKLNGGKNGNGKEQGQNEAV